MQQIAHQKWYGHVSQDVWQKPKSMAHSVNPEKVWRFGYPFWHKWPPDGELAE
jgi:hypothetical protein